MFYKLFSSMLIVMLTVIVLLPFHLSFSQEQKSYTIAVLDLEAIAVSETEALALSEKLRSSVSQIIERYTGKEKYTLVERSQMNKIFDQFEIQNTGCTDLECAVEFGKILDVQRIIIGSVSLVGETYMIIARIVDVKSAKTIRSVDRQHRGAIDDIISLMPVVGKELITGERTTGSDHSSTIISNKEPAQDDVSVLGIDMIQIPAGSFSMGSNNGEKDEKPEHIVNLNSFYISATEITQEQFRAIWGANPSHFSGNDNLPIELISWYDAVRFCNKLSEMVGRNSCYNEKTWECDMGENGFRLPTEAEWEYACRAGTSTMFYSGNIEIVLEKTGWYSLNSSGQTHTVGQKAPNAWGLYDMHGNVWEWCNDWYGSYPSENVSNPLGVKKGAARVLRGGSWNNDANVCRSVNRNYNKPGSKYLNIGFRIVRR